MNKLIEKLNQCYSEAMKNHNYNELFICFGIEYANEIEHCKITPEILVKNSMIPNSYYSILIRQGMELAKYVKVVSGILPEKQINKVEQRENDSNWIENTLKSIGKRIFVDYLYPELNRNIDITEADISEKYEEYATFSEDSRKCRLSKAKSIFKRGLQKEALRVICLSNKLPLAVKRKAESFLR